MPEWSLPGGALAALAAVVFQLVINKLSDLVPLPRLLTRLKGWRLAAVVGVVLIVLVPLSLLANKQPSDQNGLILDSHSVRPGQLARARGAGFGPREPVRVTLIVPRSGQRVEIPVAGSFAAYADGRLGVDFTVPLQATGATRLTITGNQTGKKASAEFNVPRLSPTIVLSPTSGPPGTRIEITGSDFLAGELVTLSADGRRIGSQTATSAGELLYQLTIPGRRSASQPRKDLLIAAVGRQSAPFNADVPVVAGFEITSQAPSITTRPPTTTQPPVTTRPPTSAAQPTDHDDCPPRMSARGRATA
jgi:hypothetical protein